VDQTSIIFHGLFYFQVRPFSDQKFSDEKKSQSSRLRAWLGHRLFVVSKMASTLSGGFAAGFSGWPVRAIAA
jgi:hypothetical protein